MTCKGRVNNNRHRAQHSRIPVAVNGRMAQTFYVFSVTVVGFVKDTAVKGIISVQYTYGLYSEIRIFESIS